MTADVQMTEEQVKALAPVFALRGGHILIGNVFPNGSGWTMTLRAIPAERRDSIRAACRGDLKLPRRRGKAAESTA